MARIGQIRGMLLEEVLLHFLRGTGYRTVDSPGSDPTLSDGHSGLEVKGRGGNHQIDAIADFQVPHPFSHSQRLLVEAKCYSQGKPVGIEIARNALGVVKDVSEYWVTEGTSPIPRSRYHYQYAIFSATAYTNYAQRFAFAHDIYLIPVGNSSYLTSIIEAIRAISEGDFGLQASANIPISVSGLRRNVRQGLQSGQVPTFLDDRELLQLKLATILQLTFRIDYALLAVLGGNFPVFLVPRNEATIENLRPVVQVRIRWDDSSWYIDGIDNERLFSFDLPPELFELFAGAGVLTPRRALHLKEETMSSFYAFRTLGNEVRVIRFELDMDWLQSVRVQLRTRRRTIIEPPDEP